tara:strand:+ start:260 stop:700 length:441 start_codon:yes stop_codon:yes gene_type:complete
MQTKTNNATILSFKYTTSKGRDTYGYNIVTLYANGNKVARTCGGGYDMRGTVLANYIKDNYLERLKTLKGNHGSLDDGSVFYGLMFYNAINNKRQKTYDNGCLISLDGACGENAIVRISEAIDVHLESIKLSPNEYGYILTDNKIQ